MFFLNQIPFRLLFMDLAEMLVFINAFSASISIMKILFLISPSDHHFIFNEIKTCPNSSSLWLHRHCPRKFNKYVKRTAKMRHIRNWTKFHPTNYYYSLDGVQCACVCLYVLFVIYKTCKHIFVVDVTIFHWIMSSRGCIAAFTCFRILLLLFLAM